jgi:serine/threonine protein phosphatase 1
VPASGPCESSVYAVLRQTRRVWAVASIHGEADRLARLHRGLAERLQYGDRVVYLGNVLGQGSRVLDTVDEVLRFRAEVMARPLGFAGDVAILRGAQEEMWQKLLELQFAPNPREVLAFMRGHGLDATIAAYGGDPKHGEAACRDGPLSITRWTTGLRQHLNQQPGHVQFMATLRRAAFTDRGTLLFVNAGLDATKPLDLQGDAFWWGGEPFLELPAPYETYRRVVRGFDRRHGGLVEGAYAVSLDGGSGLGGALLAACFSNEGVIVERLEA